MDFDMTVNVVRRRVRDGRITGGRLFLPDVIQFSTVLLVDASMWKIDSEEYRNLVLTLQLQLSRSVTQCLQLHKL
jgi:hypothetical protein